MPGPALSGSPRSSENVRVPRRARAKVDAAVAAVGLVRELPVARRLRRREQEAGTGPAKTRVLRGVLPGLCRGASTPSSQDVPSPPSCSCFPALAGRVCVVATEGVQRGREGIGASEVRQEREAEPAC